MEERVVCIDDDVRKVLERYYSSDLAEEGDSDGVAISVILRMFWDYYDIATTYQKGHQKILDELDGIYNK